jgi:predicted metalloendopeptidase
MSKNKSSKPTKRSSKNTTLKQQKELQKAREELIGEQIGFVSFEEEYEKSKQFSSATQASYKKTIKDLSNLIHSHFAPSKYTPKSNFYEYINYHWLTNASKEYKKEYFVELDDFRLVQDKVYRQIIDLVKIYVSENNSKLSKLMNNVYKSMLNLDEASAKKHVDATVTMVDDYIKEDNLWKLLARINKNEVVSWASPLVWRVGQDLKNSTTFRYSIGSPSLSLYDFSLYTEDDTASTEDKKYKSDVKREFLNFVQKMFDTCLGKGHGLKASDVFDVEKQMVDFYSYDKLPQDPDYYNIVTAADAKTKLGFDWAEMTKHLGFKKTPAFFITASLNYIKACTDELTQNWKSAKWRTYWIYIYLKQIIRFHKSWRSIYYGFFESFIQGQEMMFPQEIYPIFGLSVCFNTQLTFMYVEKYKNQTVIDYVNNLAYDLKKIFVRKIKRNTWLSPSTKNAALKKFEFMKLLVAHPQELQYDLLLDYDDTDAWKNIMLITDARHEEFIKLDGEKVFSYPQFDWNLFKMNEKQAYIVNCFYIATENTIYIPLAYLQRPFIDLGERGLEYNLAHVGYALGHELSHSLDTTGSRFDYKGDMISWWTPRDRNIFNKKVKDVVKQYETFANRDGIKFDAEVGTGEDMADISGLAICTEYLRDFNDHIQELVPMRAASFHKFFAHIAIQGRQRVTKKALASQLKINPHPLEVYRVNCCLARLLFFTKLYNVKKGDGMYWSNMDTIW